MVTIKHTRVSDVVDNRRQQHDDADAPLPETLMLEHRCRLLHPPRRAHREDPGARPHRRFWC
jgi:hypothetical protein